MKNKFFLYTFTHILFLTSTTHTMFNRSIPRLFKPTKSAQRAINVSTEVLKFTTAFYVTNRALTVAHELGHAVAYQLLFQEPIKGFSISLNPFKSSYIVAEYHPGLRWALMCAAGPLTSLFVSYAGLKVYQHIYNYKKNSDQTFKNSFQKSLFNSAILMDFKLPKQQRVVHSGVVTSLLFNPIMEINSLIPNAEATTDGSQILREIKNALLM